MTKAELSGNIDNPQSSVIDIVGRLIQNAFFQALLPEFDRARSMRSAPKP